MDEFEPEIFESEDPPQLVEISDDDGLIFNTRFSSDRRLRKVIYDKVLAAQTHLPDHLQFMIYEAYRPRARQFKLWKDIWAQMSTEHPHTSEEELTRLCSNFVSNPYGVGSGHQFGCAIDITLCTPDGTPMDMGTGMQEFCPKTKTECEGLTSLQISNRTLLKTSLEREGLVNYPSEWWHYSYGDRLWAQILGAQRTIYGVLPF